MVWQIRLRPRPDTESSTRYNPYHPQPHLITYSILKISSTEDTWYTQNTLHLRTWCSLNAQLLKMYNIYRACKRNRYFEIYSDGWMLKLNEFHRFIFFRVLRCNVVLGKDTILHYALPFTNNVCDYVCTLSGVCYKVMQGKESILYI